MNENKTMIHYGENRSRTVNELKGRYDISDEIRENLINEIIKLLVDKKLTYYTSQYILEEVYEELGNIRFN